MKDVQLRGNCQCCGNQQAVNGHMAKHGYTIDYGWFNGVCQGASHKPMQEDRSVTDKIVSEIWTQVADLLKRAEDLKYGKITPNTCFSGNYVFTKDANGYSKREEVMIPFAEGMSWHQDSAVRTAIFNAEHRAKMGASFAKYLEDIANKVHGTPLVEVKKPEAAERLISGEQRILGNGKIATMKYQDGARIYWTYENSDGKVFKSWTGTQAWRKLAIIER